MASCSKLWEIFNTFFLQVSVERNLISLKDLSLAGDGTPVYTAAQERKHRTCKCLEKGIRDCNCDRCHTSRKSIPDAPGIMAEISGIIRRIQTDREDGNKLFFAYASYESPFHRRFLPSKE